MITSKPGFFSDWGRFSLGIAIRKRWGSFRVGDNNYRYSQILAMDPQQLSSVLCTAAQYNEEYCACFAFEAMLINAGGSLETVWPHAVACLCTQSEATALRGLDPLLERYLNSDQARLMSIPLNAQGNYLVGKKFSDAAFAAKGSNKGRLQDNKKKALHFLGEARKRVDEEKQQPQHDPYRAAAMAAALAASVAAAYEAAAYLQWKGTRTAALAE